MNSTATVSAALFGEVCRVGRSMGYALPAQSQPACAGARVPLYALHRSLGELRRQSGDDDIGLRAGRMLNPTCFAITGYLVMAGPTLLDALPRISRFQRLVADGVKLDVAVDTDALHLHWQFGGLDQPREFIDLLMSGVRYFGVWLLGDEPPLLQAAFTYPRPRDQSLHEAIFGSSLQFGSERNGFSLARRWLAVPLCTADASLVPLLEKHARQLLAAFRRNSGLAAISQAVIELIPDGEVGVGRVAQRLAKSTRSLQRELRAHGTTFHRLLQELRMEMANDYLASSELSLQEIAARLGYREQSSFCHAYRNWTGRAPGDARRCLSAEQRSSARIGQSPIGR
jgi:AraC-like DNA-binding protein